MKLKNKTLFFKMSLALAPAALLMAAPAAHSADSIADAIAGGKVSANIQARYEAVDTPNTSATGNAKALTARLRLGYETGEYQNFGGMFQVSTIAARGTYADNQANSRQSTTLDKVNDASGTSVTQSYVSYSGIADTKIKLGRQVIRYDNDRWVGNVDWRQNWQSYDATSLTNKSLADTTIQAAYVTNVNRPSGDNGAGAPNTMTATSGNTHMKSTLLNVHNTSFGLGEVTGYNYRLDYTDTANAIAQAYGSTNTTGLKIQGSAPVAGYKASYVAEYASQKNFRTNTTHYTAIYTNVEAGLDVNFAKFNVGQEVLGSNNGRAVSTPLSTLFAFNGWADMFLVTPTTGLKDMYVKARSNAFGVTYGADWHSFKSDTTSQSYGRELDLIAEKQIDKTYAVGARAARFKTDTNGAHLTNGSVAIGGVTLTDTNKMWLYGSMAF